MTRQPPVPTEIRRLGVHSVRIEWKDGHRSEYTNQYLREQCPCAECRERPRRLPVVNRPPQELYPVQMGIVGRYAVSIEWSDGHDTGIYSYHTLREICPCPECRSADVTGTEKAR